MNSIRLFTAINRLRPSSISIMNSRTKLHKADFIDKRIKNKVKNKTIVTNNANLIFVGGAGQGLSPSLIINSGGNSYLFNCGEGFQRYCYTNKIKLQSIENVFVTRQQWNHIAGVIGLSITLHASGTPNFCLHSAGGAGSIFDVIKTFVNAYEGGSNNSVNNSLTEYHDSSIKIKPIVLTDVSTLSCPEKKSKLRTDLIAYSCELCKEFGTLDPIKCKELGVPVGRHLNSLKTGQDVTLPDGKLIRSSDVCGPMKRGANLIILECPSESHIETVIKNPTLEQLKGARDSKGEKQIDFVVHFTPQSITEEPRYREWIDGFSDECKHFFVLHNQRRQPDFTHIYQYQYILSKLDARIFPQLYLPDNLKDSGEAHSKESPRNLQDGKFNYKQQAHKPDVLMAVSDFPTDRFINVNSMDKYVLRPRKHFEYMAESEAFDAAYREVELVPGFDKELAKLRSLQANIPAPREFEPEVVFLGTGSSIPSKYRNTSCIMLNFHHTKASVILDCGEDSYGQMYRFYGPDRLKEILKQLKMIYISHHHLDHHIGLIEILRHRRELTNEPLQLVLPAGLEDILNYHNSNFDDLRSSYKLHITETSSMTFKFKQDELVKRLEGLLENIDIIRVEHCKNACSVIMRFVIGHPEMKTFTVAYSGDSIPNDEFTIMGRGCDLLIHEATIEDGEEDDALIKKHSTSGQAIKVAKKMRAKFTILTHFTQRLAKIPYFTELFDDTIGFAFDNMSVRCPTDLARIPIQKPSLKLAFQKFIVAADYRRFRKEEKRDVISNYVS